MFLSRNQQWLPSSKGSPSLTPTRSMRFTPIAPSEPKESTRCAGWLSRLSSSCLTPSTGHTSCASPGSGTTPSTHFGSGQIPCLMFAHFWSPGMFRAGIFYRQKVSYWFAKYFKWVLNVWYEWQEKGMKEWNVFLKSVKYVPARRPSM